MQTDRGDGERGAAALARALRDPERELLGTVVSTVDPVFAEIVASRFDFVWIDLEHSALSVRDVQALVIAANSGGAYSLIRLPGPEIAAIGALLDTGADGIVIPRLESVESMRAVAAELQFPPRGRRGYAPRRAALSTEPPAPGDRPACVVQIESRSALEAANEFAAQEVCDALVVGTADLSFDVGLPMQLSHPGLVDAVTHVNEAAAAAGKGWGVAAGGPPEELRRLATHGSTLVYGSDVRLFAEIIERRSRAFRGPAPDG